MDIVFYRDHFATKNCSSQTFSRAYTRVRLDCRIKYTLNYLLDKIITINYTDIVGKWREKSTAAIHILVVNCV